MAFGRGRKLGDENSLYEYAIGALGRRMRSVAELKRLMRQRVEPGELGEALVELVIAKLKEQHYLNDAQYASTYSSLRKENDKFGRRRVITELKSRGVHSEVIEKAVAGVYAGVNEETQAREYLRRKRLQKPANQKQAARIFRTLVRAGFGTRTIISILKKWDVDDEVLSALESEEPS
jgi:regulatory protein